MKGNSTQKELDREARERLIAKLRREGASLREISLATGLSEGGISHAINRMKLSHKWTNPVKTEADEEVATRRKAGQGWTQIAQEMKVDMRVVRLRGMKLGIDLGKQGRPSNGRAVLYAADRAAGMTCNAIATKYSISAKAVDAALRRHYLKQKIGQ